MRANPTSNDGPLIKTILDLIASSPFGESLHFGSILAHVINVRSPVQEETEEATTGWPADSV